MHTLCDNFRGQLSTTAGQEFGRFWAGNAA